MAPSIVAAAVALAALTAPHANGADRNRAARAEFQRLHPCPATGARRGPCPGWVVDHVHPLCAGGADAPHNMQWQERAEAALKDRQERAMCRLRQPEH